VDNRDNKPSVFGQSLRLQDGDLRFANQELDMVVGRDNLMQSLRAMIDTPFGSDIFNVNYGFDTLAILSGQTTLGQTKDLIRLNIVKSLSQDNRIREIQDVIFDDDPRYLATLTPSAIADLRQQHIFPRRWQATVVLATVPEGDVTLQLQGTGLKA